MERGCIVIGVCGGSGSGKTTFVNQLLDNIPDQMAVKFSLDNYYLPIEEQVVDKNGKVNFDLPTALDIPRLAADLKSLVAGEAIRIEQYDFNCSDKGKTYIDIPAAPIVIAEGIFLFAIEQVKALLTHTIFVETNLDKQLERRLLRDENERGYPREEILYQWNEHVLPAYNQYLLPHKETANHVVCNNVSFDNEAQVIAHNLIKNLEPVLA